MTRAELLDLFTPIYDQFFMMAFESPAVVYPRVADVVEDPTKDWKYNNISSLGKWEAVDEDSDDGLDNFVMGYEGSVSQQKYRKYFYVTFEMDLQMEYAELKKKIIDAKVLGQGGVDAVEDAIAGKIRGVFATAGADGVYIASNSHPKNPSETGTTYDNLLAGGFSHDNLELAESQRASNHFDMDGRPIQITETPILLYPPALNGVVMRVLSDRANDRPGTDNRDINIYAGKYDPVQWVYLSAALGGTDTQWHILYSSLKMLKLIWGAKPQTKTFIHDLYHRYYFDGWEFFTSAITDWRFIFSSTGLG